MPFLSIIGALFSGWLKRIAAIAANIPPKVWYALGIVLSLLFLWHVHSGFEKRAHDADIAKGIALEKVNTDREIEKNRITTQSLNDALASIHTQNAAIDKMVDESNGRMKAGSDALAAAKRTRNATESAVQALQASAGKTGLRDAPCVPSEAFLKHSGEL